MGLKNPLRRNKKKGGYSGGISTSSPRARFGNWGGATAPPAIRYGHSDDSNNSTIATNQPSLSKYEQKISSSAYNGRQNEQFAQPLGLSSPPPQPQQVEVGNNEGSSWAVWGQQQGNRGGEADTFQHQPQSITNNNRQHQVSRNSPFTDLAASRYTSTDMSRPPRSPGRNGSSGGGYHTTNEQLDPPEEVFNKHRRTKSHGSQALHQQQHRRTGSHYSSSGLSDYGSSTGGQSSPGAAGLKAAMQREISRHRTDQGQGGQGQHVRNNSRGSSQGNHSRSNSRGSQGGRVGPSMPILDEGVNRGRTAERQGHTRSRSVGRNSVGRNTGKKVGALAAVGGASLGSRHFNSLRVGRRGKSQDESTLETTSDEQHQQLHPNSRFHSAEESEIHDSGYFCDAPLVPNTNERGDESTMFAEESTAFNESTITGETTTVEDTVGGEESTEVSNGKSKYDTKKKKAVAKQQDEEETDFSTDVDEESYMTRDEDESYMEEEEEVSYDGTYDSSYIDDESYVSEDNRHRRRGSGRRGSSRRSRGGRRRRPSVDPSTSPGANDNTWASWFGFGGDEEETVYTPDDSAAPDSERSDSVVDPSVETKANDEQRRNSIVSGETTVVEEEKKSPSNNKEKKTNNKVAAVASTAAVVTGAAAVAAVVSHTHDREGRPLPESKPVRRVPSFKKSWMKSVLPTSGGGDGGATYRGAWNENKTVTSEDVIASTVSTKGSKTKTTATPKSGIANLGNRLFDVDKRQRDIYCEKHGGVENLIVRQYDEAPMPEDSNHVLVMVEASTVSSRDCTTRLKGDANDTPKPSVPGFHIVGSIYSLGSDVNPSTFRVGDRVAALLPNGGGNAKYVSIPLSSVMRLPNNADHEDIICLVGNYMTAYQCLKLAKKDGAPLTNANVLITGGSGPVGQALVELALREGANVFATAHKMHEEHLTKLGAKWFSVKPKKWLPQLEGKMDVVIDNLCIDGYDSSYRALTPDGTLICNSDHTSAEIENDPREVCLGCDDGGMTVWWSGVKTKYFRNRAIFYDVNESYEKNSKMFCHELNYLICKLQRGEINPKVAGKVSLNQVPKAQKLIEKGLPNGTVVCLPWKKLDPKQKVRVEEKKVVEQ